MIVRKSICEDFRYLKPKSEEDVNNVMKNMSSGEILYRGAKANSVWMVKKAIEMGVTSVELKYALGSAVFNSYIDIVKILLDAGAPVSENNFHPLRVACSCGDLDMFKALLDAEADPTEVNLGQIGGDRQTENDIIDMLKLRRKQLKYKNKKPPDHSIVYNESFKYLKPKTEKEIQKIYPEYHSEADNKYEEMREALNKTSMVWLDIKEYPNKALSFNLANEYQCNRYFDLSLKTNKCELAGPWYSGLKNEDFQVVQVDSMEDIEKIIDKHLEEHPLEFLPEWRKKL